MSGIKGFDFWDTLVTRAVHPPSMVFEVIERRTGVTGFAAERIRAEQASRTGHAETTLDRIYEATSYDQPLREHLKQVELDTEARLASRIEQNAELYGAGDLIVSDMYMSSSQIQTIAQRCGLRPELSRIFVSSEHNATKRTGELFAKLLHRHRLTSFIGDNLLSDVVIPRRRGISCSHFSQAEPTGAELKQLNQCEASRYLVGLIRAARLARPRGSDELLWSLYTRNWAPLLTQFVEWLLQDAQSRGLQRLYFLSRDGYLPFRIAQQIVRARSLSMDCRYLFASRRALRLSTLCDTKRAIEWILEPTSVLNGRIVAQRIGLTPAQLWPHLREVGFSSMDDQIQPELREQVARALTHVQVAGLIRETASLARSNARSYLLQEGIPSNAEQAVGVVDVGWHGSCQTAIRELVRAEGTDGPDIHGYYIGVARRTSHKSSAFVHGFIMTPFEVSKRENDWLDGFRGLIEASLPANHPSVAGYERADDGSYRPLFSDPEFCTQHERVATIEAAVDVFVSRYLQLTALVGNMWFLQSGTPLANLKRFLTRPTREEALAYAMQKHTEQQVETDFVPVVKRLGLAAALRKGRNWSWGIWPEGSHKISRLEFIWKARLFVRRVLSGRPDWPRAAP